MGVLAVGIGAHFRIAPRLAHADPRFRQLVFLLGALGALGLVTVSILSSDRAPTLHGVAVLLAGPAGLTAALLTLLGLLGRRRYRSPSLWLGGLMLVIALGTLLQYARQFVLGAPDSVWLPVGQKLATVLALAWMCVVALETRDPR
jgi:hypothetical protein